MQRFSAQQNSIRVVKARLSENRRLRAWLACKGYHVRMLPTLILVRDGRPVRTMGGADKIMDASKLHTFATDPVEADALSPEEGCRVDAPIGLLGLFDSMRTTLGWA